MPRDLNATATAAGKPQLRTLAEARSSCGREPAATTPKWSSVVEEEHELEIVTPGAERYECMVIGPQPQPVRVPPARAHADQRVVLLQLPCVLETCSGQERNGSSGERTSSHDPDIAGAPFLPHLEKAVLDLRRIDDVAEIVHRYVIDRAHDPRLHRRITHPGDDGGPNPFGLFAASRRVHP